MAGSVNGAVLIEDVAMVEKKHLEGDGVATVFDRGLHPGEDGHPAVEVRVRAAGKQLIKDGSVIEKEIRVEHVEPLGGAGSGRSGVESPPASVAEVER